MMETLVADAKAKGARVTTGGTGICDRGYYFPPRRRRTISASSYGAAPTNPSWRAKARHPQLAVQLEGKPWMARLRTP
jgi:hypothetical protein